MTGTILLVALVSVVGGVLHFGYADVRNFRPTVVESYCPECGAHAKIGMNPMPGHNPGCPAVARLRAERERREAQEAKNEADSA